MLSLVLNTKAQKQHLSKLILAKANKLSAEGEKKETESLTSCSNPNGG